MEIVPGLYQLKVPIPNNPIGYVLPYLFEVPGGCAIIDPGWNADESFEALQSQFVEIGASLSDVKQVIVTHVHPDHYGLAGRVREASGARVLVHEEDREHVRERQGAAGTNYDAWFKHHGLPPVDGAFQAQFRPGRQWAEAVEPDDTMVDGQLLKLGRFELRVIWTPGHSPGHACFYMEEQEMLLSGDHILPTISPNVSLWPGADADPLGDYLRSLGRLRGLRTKRVLPAHEYSFNDLDKRLDELEHHHEERLQEMLNALTAGATTAYEVARKVQWTIGSFDSFNPGTQRAALTETVAHLHYLQGVGRVSLSEKAGVANFYAS